VDYNVVNENENVKEKENGRGSGGRQTTQHNNNMEGQTRQGDDDMEFWLS